jgi:hypothetical protein
MPTGYTSEILEGKINTFKDFAKKCMRAFGATIHMRDDSLNESYRPREIDRYYIEQVEEAEEKLKVLKTADDEFFIDKVREELKSDYAYYEEKLRKVKADGQKLNSILVDVKKWNPPTDDHVDIKDFMIQQLEETIKYDANCKHYEEELQEIKIKLESPIDVAWIKHQMIENAEKDLQRSKERLEEERKRCEDSNKWVSVFLQSIE